MDNPSSGVSNSVAVQAWHLQMSLGLKSPQDTLTNYGRDHPGIKGLPMMTTVVQEELNRDCLHLMNNCFPPSEVLVHQNQTVQPSRISAEFPQSALATCSRTYWSDLQARLWGSNSISVMGDVLVVRFTRPEVRIPRF